MKHKLLFASFFIFSVLNADISHGVLEKYRTNKRLFIGTGMGNYVTIARAINAGFEEMFSLEEDEVLVEHKKCLVPSDNYHAFKGIPALELFNLLSNINEPAVIFLGTYFPNIDETSVKNTILEELDQIKKHHINTHTILIDYIHYADTPYFGDITLQDIKNKILTINPQYKFSLEKGGHLEREENAVLTAYLD